jgi:hypothetical protein
MCNYFGQVYQFRKNGMEHIDIFGLNWGLCNDETSCSVSQDDQFNAITNRRQGISKGSIDEIRSQIKDGFILLP